MMSFCKGFEKLSGAARVLGQTAGYTSRGAAATTKVGKQAIKNTANVIKEHSKKQRTEFAKGFQEARGAATTGAAKEPKKSFASRHPYMTAGLLYLGTKTMLSGGDKDQPAQQPQYIGPQ